MENLLASGEVTAFPFAVRSGRFFEGRVNVLAGPAARRVQHVCLGVRDTLDAAMEDAHADAVRLVRLWRQQRKLGG